MTFVVLSRLAYRKGTDLLVATAPRICSAFPNVRFVVGTYLTLLLSPLFIVYPGGDGLKLIDLLQMREKHNLQDRIELPGPMLRGPIFLNMSLTDSFGIAILEALYVVSTDSTRVGGGAGDSA